MRTVASIGVYGFSAQTFLDALRKAGVAQVLDVRQRRGVRGSEYAWANAKRLQDALAQAGIVYRHHKELAPTTELRQLQYHQDARLGVGQRSRVVLAAEFRDRYREQILDAVDLGSIVRAMPSEAAAALLCVERDPEACHRSLITDRMRSQYGVTCITFGP